MVRGGSWFFGAQYCRSATRFDIWPGIRVRLRGLPPLQVCCPWPLSPWTLGRFALQATGAALQPPKRSRRPRGGTGATEEVDFKIPLTPFVKGGVRGRRCLSPFGKGGRGDFVSQQDGPERRNPLRRNSFHRADPAWALLIGSWCSTGSFGGCNRAGATRGFCVNGPLSALLSLCRPVEFPLLSRPEDFSRGRSKTKCCSETP